MTYKFVTREEIEHVCKLPYSRFSHRHFLKRLLSERDAAFQAGEEAFLRGYSWASREKTVLDITSGERFNEKALREEFRSEAARILESKK